MKLNIIRLFIFLIFYLSLDIIFSLYYIKETSYSCYDVSKNFYSLLKNCNKQERYGKINYNVKTDAYGYRVGNIKKEEKKENILFLGDSQIYGVGLNFQDSFIGRLEKKQTNYNFYNLGVPSYSPLMYNYTLKNFLKTKKANKVFIFLDLSDLLGDNFIWSRNDNTNNGKPFLINQDILDNIELGLDKKKFSLKEFKKKYFKGSRIISRYINNFFRKIKKTFKLNNEQNNLITTKTNGGEFTYTSYNNLPNIWKQKKFSETKLNFKKNIMEITNNLRSKKIDYYFIIMPWPETLEYGQDVLNWETYIKNICNETKCKKVINFFPIFKKIKKDNKNWAIKLYLENDFHPNKYGSKLIAEEIFDIIN